MLRPFRYKDLASAQCQTWATLPVHRRSCEATSQPFQYLSRQPVLRAGFLRASPACSCPDLRLEGGSRRRATICLSPSAWRCWLHSPQVRPERLPSAVESRTVACNRMDLGPRGQTVEARPALLSGRGKQWPELIKRDPRRSPSGAQPGRGSPAVDKPRVASTTSRESGRPPELRVSSRCDRGLSRRCRARRLIMPLSIRPAIAALAEARITIQVASVEWSFQRTTSPSVLRLLWSAPNCSCHRPATEPCTSATLVSRSSRQYS